MLSLGPGSSCDVCYEKFGPDAKAPWSIECGHVFCASCISNITSPCPMCRNPFDHEACIKLHVDLDDVSGETVGPSVPDEGPTAEVQEARRIWKAISDIPLGATEPTMRQLVHDGEAFFKQQQESTLFKDLKAVFQITGHLYDVKRKYRSQVQKVESLDKQLKELEGENEELKAEKARLLKQLEKSEETRQYEAETAAAVETSLRDHFAQAKQNEKEATQLLKKLQSENEDLRAQLNGSQNRRPTSKTHRTKETKKDSDFPPLSTSFSMPTVFDNLDPDSTAIHDPTSFIISPFLPNFQDTILPMVDAISALPGLEEDSGESQENSDNEDAEVPTSQASNYQLQPRGSQEIKTRPSVEALSHTRPVGRSVQEPSGLSRTAPYREHHRRERSCSNPSQPTSRSHSPFNSIVSSTCPTPPIQTAATHHGASSREIHSSAQPGGVSQVDDRHVLRSRLQDLLSDKPATSASLPNVSSSHFPSSLTSRDAAAGAHREERGSSLPKSVLSDGPSLQHQTSHNFSHLLASHQSQLPTIIKPPPSTSPHPVRVSSASAEAKKLEEERRRKHREEKDKYGQEHDRVQGDADRETRRFTAPSFASNATSSASQAARRDQQQQPLYINPISPNTNSTTTPSRRNPPSNSSNGPYGRPGQTIPSPHEQGPVPPPRYTTASSSLKSAVPKNSFPPSNPPIYA